MPAMLSRLPILTALLLAQTSHAAPLTILAEEWPPFVFLNAIDRPAGMAVEIVEAIQQRTGDIAPMAVHSWDSALAIMDSQPHHMMFTLGATDVDHVGALDDHLLDPGDRPPQGVMATPVGERIGCDVEHTHDEGLVGCEGYCA